MGSPAISPGMGAGITTGLGGLAGAFPDVTNRTGRTTSSGMQQGNTATNTSSQSQNFLNFLNNLTGSSSGSMTGTTTSTPNLTPQMQAYINSLIAKGGNLQAPALTGYTAQQTQNINANADAQRQAIANIMASRGLTTSPAAATAAAGVEQNRINQITQMQEQVPLLQNQLQLQNLAQSAQLAAMFPGLAGSTQAGTTQQQQQQQQQTSGQQQQDQYAQAWQNVFNWLQQFGTQDTTSTEKQGGGLGGALGGISSAFATVLPFLMASDRKLKKEIKDISQDKAIEKVRELRSKTWKWKNDGSSSSGVIAQEIAEVMPELVHDLKLEGREVKAVNYAGIIPYLIGAVQNLDSRTQELEA